MGKDPGKVALVTGANSGIGKAAATGLARHGFHVTLVVRDATKGEAAKASIEKAVPGARLDVLLIDLSSQDSIREGAAKFQRSHPQLNVLVNAAGVFLPTRLETDDGLERTIATNYLAYFLLTKELLPALRKGAPSRVINVSSRYGRAKIDFDDLQFEKRPFSYMKAVPPTMVARVLFTQELAARVKEDRIVVNAVHPGLVAGTQLLEQTRGFFRWLTNTFGRSAEKGAETIVWLATAPEAADETGKLWTRRKPLKTPGQGSDPEARRRLWEESERLVGAGASTRRGKDGKPSKKTGSKS